MKKLLYALAATGLLTVTPKAIAQQIWRNAVPPNQENEKKSYFPPNMQKPNPQPAQTPGQPAPNHPQKPGPAAAPHPTPGTTTAQRPAHGPVVTPHPTHGPTQAPHPAPEPVVTPRPAPGPVVTPRPAPGPVVTPRPAPGPVVTPHPAPGPVAPPKPIVAPQPQVHHPPHHHHPGPNLPPGYRPGFKAFTVPRPYDRSYYVDWVRPRHKQFFELTDLPDAMQIYLRPGEELEIKLEEERKDGYEWFARFDNYYVDIDIDHEKGHRDLFGNRQRYAEIEIEGKRVGSTIVELIYANRRAWDNGDAPEEVITIYVLTE